MNKHVNLSAYNNVENLKNFSEEEFKKYCDDKIKGCKKHTFFLKSLFKEKKFDICEIGSGNSKLLYSLENQDLIKSGMGIEISNSRYLFAEKFKEYVNSKKIENLNKNVFELELDKKFDLIIGVDIVLQLISPISDDAEKNLLDWIYSSLNENGYVIFELWSFSKYLKLLNFSNTLNIREEFDESDPYKYVLANISLDENNNVIWNKKFIKRDNSEESTFKNILKPYSKEEITRILLENNFKDIKIYDYWKVVGDCDEDEFIVVAKK